MGAAIFAAGFIWGHHTATTQCVDMAFQLARNFGIEKETLIKLLVDVINST